MVVHLFVTVVARHGSRSVDGIPHLQDRDIVSVSTNSHNCFVDNTSSAKPAPQSREPNGEAVIDFVKRKWVGEHPIYRRFFEDRRCMQSLECDNEMQRIFETAHRHRSSAGPRQALLAVTASNLVRASRELRAESIRLCNAAINSITNLDSTQATPFSEDMLMTIVLLNLYEVCISHTKH